MKKCSKCKITKEFKDFRERVDRKDSYVYLCKECVRKNYKEKNIRKRFKVLSYYGLECKCCGEKEIKFLSIDHINGGGNLHRKEMRPTDTYQWLIKNNFPDGFQTLCHNCNMAKGMYKKCPHQE